MLLEILEVHPRIMRILRHADVSMTLEAPANASSTAAGEALRRLGSGQRNGHDVKLRRAARRTVWHEHLAAGRPAGRRALRKFGSARLLSISRPQPQCRSTVG